MRGLPRHTRCGSVHTDMKAQARTPKKQGGISLRPELWERIDEAARLAGVPRNQVMETALMRAFKLVPDFRKETTRKTKETDVHSDALPELDEEND